MRLRLLAIFALAAAHSVSAAEPAWKELVREGFAAHKAHDRAGALTRFASAVADPSFTSAAGAERHGVLSIAGIAAVDVGQWSDALRYLRAAQALPERDADDFLWGLRAAGKLGDRRARIEILTGLARFDAKTFRQLGEEVVFLAFADSRNLWPGDPARFLLRDAAFDARFRTNNGEVAGWVWIDLARLLLERGDGRKAERVIAELEDPNDLVDVRADRAFAALVDARPGRFDVVAAAQGRVARLQAVARSKPRSLEAAHGFVVALAAAGRGAEALRVADIMIARAASPRAFDDTAGWLAWMRNARSDILWHEGRWQEAVAELERAAPLPEYGGANTSQIINLAERYSEVGRAAEALKVLQSVGPMSPYGKMALEMARARAAGALGDAGTIAASLTYLRDHQADAPRMLEETLVMAGLLDEAAKVLIAELDDASTRTEALHALQEFDEGPPPPTPSKWKANWPKLLARDDVKAAIARYGRIESYPLPRQ